MNARFFQDIATLIFSIVGITLTIIEVTCYIILFRYLWHHDNKMAKYLDTKVIKSRNRANAVSLTGLFATWALELVYIIFGGLLSIVIKDSNLLREVVSSLIPFEYYFIPLIQIYTSPNIKSFMDKFH